MTFDAKKAAELVAMAMKDDAGFSGRFFYDAERGDIAYIAKKCEDKQCDCEPSYNADGDIDCSVSLLDDTGNVDDICEPIARMLNRHRALAEQLAAASAEVERMRAVYEAAVKWHRTVMYKWSDDENSELFDTIDDLLVAESAFSAKDKP